MFYNEQEKLLLFINESYSRLSDLSIKAFSTSEKMLLELPTQWLNEIKLS